MTLSGDAEVTVVVVTFRGAAFLAACLEGLAQQSVPHELLVIDNNSTDGTAALLNGQFPEVDVLRLATNVGFAGGVAAALPRVTTPFVALLNDDAVPDPGWLEELLAVARVEVHAAAWTSLIALADRPGLINNLGTGLDRKCYGVDVGSGLPLAAAPSKVVDVFGFCGGAALLRTQAVRAVGGFPSAFFIYYEDLDTSWRLRLAGWRIRLVPAAVVIHAHAATSDRRSSLFHYHNERNRLWTLLRCAPTPTFLRAFGRFGLTTGSLAVKRILKVGVPQSANFELSLRLKVLRTVLVSAPAIWWSAPRRTADRAMISATLEAALALSDATHLSDALVSAHPTTDRSERDAPE